MRGFCELTNRKRRPQQGCTTSSARNARLLRIEESQTSTSTGMHHFGHPECEASANLGIANVDLNEDAALRVPRMRGFCEFRSRKRRPQRGCTTLGAQNARLLRIYSLSRRLGHTPSSQILLLQATGGVCTNVLCHCWGILLPFGSAFKSNSKSMHQRPVAGIWGILLPFRFCFYKQPEEYAPTS